MNLKAYAMTLTAALAAHLPERVVTRDLKTFRQLHDQTPATLKKGRFTVVSAGVNDVDNMPGNAAHGGTWKVGIVGQFTLGDTAATSEIEDMESDLFDDIVSFLNSDLDESIGCLVLKSMGQSQQREHPDGWIACTFEVIL